MSTSRWLRVMRDALVQVSDRVKTTAATPTGTDLQKPDDVNRYISTLHFGHLPSYSILHSIHHATQQHLSLDLDAHPLPDPRRCTQPNQSEAIHRVSPEPAIQRPPGFVPCERPLSGCWVGVREQAAGSGGELEGCAGRAGGGREAAQEGFKSGTLVAPSAVRLLVCAFHAMA